MLQELNPIEVSRKQFLFHWIVLDNSYGVDSEMRSIPPVKTGGYLKATPTEF